MKIIFSKLKIHNFLSYADETFDFETHRGLNLICGKNNDIPGSSNGAGKSGIMAALCYALYGDTQSHVKRENLHNKYIEGKDLSVSIHFKIENGTEYEIVSGANKHGEQYVNVKRFKDGEWEDLTKSSIAETRSFISDEILHCGMGIFMRTILLTSDQTYNFFKLKSAEKKEFIEKLFDIGVFGKIYALAHRDTLDLEKKLIALQNQLIMLQKNASEYYEYIKTFEKNKKEKIEQYSNKLKNLETLKETTEKKEEKILENKIEKLKVAKNKIDTFLKTLNQKKIQIDNSLNKIIWNQKQNEVSWKDKQKLLEKFQDLEQKLCEKCKKIFSNYHNLDALNNEIQGLFSKINSEKEERKNLESKKKDLENKFKKYEEKVSTLTLTIEKNLNGTRNESEKLKKLNLEIESLKRNLNSEINSINPYKELQEKNKKETELVSENVSKSTVNYRKQKCAENIVSQDTLKKFIVKDLIHLLNDRIKVYLSKLGSNYSCVFNDDMSYSFKTKGGACEYGSFSSGERMRLNIAASFTFRDLMASRSNLSSNILILDEYIDSNIDSLAIDGILNILKEFVFMYKQNIYVISHRKEIDNSVFQHIIRVIKTNNISKIEYIS